MMEVEVRIDLGCLLPPACRLGLPHVHLITCSGPLVQLSAVLTL